MAVTLDDIKAIQDHLDRAQGGEIANVISDLEELERKAPDLFGRAHEPLSMAKDEVDLEDARELLNKALALIVADLRRGGRRRRRTRGRKSRRKTLRKRK